MFGDYFLICLTLQELRLLIALLESLDHSRIDSDSSKIYSDLLIYFSDKLGGL